jgi:uncharacterized membrane protein
MATRFSRPHLVILLLLLGLLLGLIQVGAITIAFDKLGLSATAIFAVLFFSLFGSLVNIPLFSIEAEAPTADMIPPAYRSLLQHARMEFTGRTVIAVNVGGCILPVLLSAYLLFRHELMIWQALTGIVTVTLVSRLASRPIPGIGIGMPLLLAPLTSAMIALLLNPDASAPLAYISGTLGVLLGADVLRLNDVRQMGTPMAAIGGAGTFDGIFITGIVAVLLA